MSQRLGEKWVWFYGEVVNVKDPHKSGRVQVRVKGYHDDKSKIPDDKLPWAQVLLPVSSAGVHKVGASPTGLLPKSKVVGFWFDPDDLRIPIVMGSIGSAGDLDEQGGKSNGGTIPPKEKTNSTNPLARPKGKDDAGGDRNPKPLQNAIAPNTERKNDDSLPKESITDIAAKGMKFANLNSIGTLSNMAGGVLQTILKADPGNKAGAIPSAVKNILGMQAISSLSNPSGIFNMAMQVLQTLMQKSSSEISQAPNAGLNNILETLIQFIQSGEFQKLSDDNKKIFYEALKLLLENPNEPVIPNSNTEILSTLTNGIEDAENPQEVVDAVCQKCIDEVFKDLLELLKKRNIKATELESILLRLITCLQREGTKATLGNQAGENQNNLAQIAQLLFSLGGNVVNTLKTTLPKSANDQNKISEALNKFTKNQARLKKKEDKAKAALGANQLPNPEQLLSMVNQIAQVLMNQKQEQQQQPQQQTNTTANNANTILANTSLINFNNIQQI